MYPHYGSLLAELFDVRRILSKIYKSDKTYLFSLRYKDIVQQTIPEAIECREVTRAELIRYSKDPKYPELCERSIEGIGGDYDHRATGTFDDGVLTAYQFFGMGIVDKSKNSAGYPFEGIGLRMPEDVVYLYKGFALPEYRGRGHTAISIELGARQLLGSNGWVITTADINNHSSIRMLEKVGLRKQRILKEYRILRKGIYRFPSEVQLGASSDIDKKTVTIFK